MPRSSGKETDDVLDIPHAASFIYLLGRVDQGVRRELRGRLSSWGLSLPEFTALYRLEQRTGLSNAQLARHTMVAPQSMIEILAALERRRLVRRSADQSHGGILRAELTSAGRRLLRAARTAIDETQETMLADVSRTQREMVLGTLIEVMHNLQSKSQGSTSDQPPAKASPPARRGSSPPQNRPRSA